MVKELVVAGNHLLGWPLGLQVAVIEQQNPIVKRLNQAHVVGHKNNGLALPTEAVYALHAIAEPR